jgi:hypothetical protein
MNSEPLTPFLSRVLAAFQEHAIGIDVDPVSGEPDEDVVRKLANILGETEDDVRQALIGLRFEDCLMDEVYRFEGIEDIVRWTVHPQCL